MNPDETAPQVNPEIVSLMKTSGSILEGAEIRKESGKTIIKPKKKITLKEFLASQPYKLTLDNSVPQPKSAPCDWRWSSYLTLEKFSPMDGKTVGFFFTNTNPNPSWNDLREKYGFSKVMIHYGNYNFVRGIGWPDSSIILRLPWEP